VLAVVVAVNEVVDSVNVVLAVVVAVNEVVVNVKVVLVVSVAVTEVAVTVSLVVVELVVVVVVTSKISKLFIFQSCEVIGPEAVAHDVSMHMLSSEQSDATHAFPFPFWSNLQKFGPVTS